MNDTETQYCVIPLCEWEAVTERGERHLCAQCAQAFDAGVEYAERTGPIPPNGDRATQPLVIERGSTGLLSKSPVEGTPRSFPRA